ncbi:hypothetical protein Pyn_01317 [Prunus yedoensis var. nudiflora]|uniref:Uncharacterized protein n=1 Tax=Prunus yedoensis var. nudiflora TaxID=2094558 RepID=A0A314YBF2_PRUYE|nr:hypothetical protein Pyn_01317 [Prunus yedoensis var. nudiflora]
MWMTKVKQIMAEEIIAKDPNPNIYGDVNDRERLQWVFKVRRRRHHPYSHLLNLIGFSIEETCDLGLLTEGDEWNPRSSMLWW